MPSFIKMHLLAASMSSLFLLPSLAFAKDVPTKSTITNVTVFPNSAEITRQANIEIDETGDHVLILDNLPQYLDSNSLRIEGKTTGILEIGSIDHRVSFAPNAILDKTERKKIEDQIQVLKDKRDLLDSTIKISQTQKVLIESLSKLPTQPVHSYGNGNAAQKQDWGNLFDLMGEKLAIAYNTVHETNIARRKVSKDIDELLKKLQNHPGQQIRRSVVKINVKVSEAVKGQIKLRYQIRNANWQPVYDARLATTGDKADLKLVRMASITQRSGENWDNISLKLSTTQPARGVTAPHLRPIRVEFLGIHRSSDPKKKRFLGMINLQKENDKGAMIDQMQTMAAPTPAPVMRKMARRRAKVQKHAFQTIFEIPGKVSIKANGQSKKLRIMSEDLKPELEARAVPKRNTNAYLYANFKLPPKAIPLLSGQVFLFRDGIYVGKSYLPQIGPGEKHEMGFGIDDKIKVKYAELKRAKGETGIFVANKTDKRQFKITVKNLHEKKVQVKIIDQIPYTNNEKIIIEMLPSSTKPTHKNLKDKRGILSWERELSAGQEDIIKLDYKISWPAKGNQIIYR